VIGESKTQALLDLISKQGVVRSADLRPYGIPREYLSRLHREGILERAGRGVYYLPDTKLTEHHSLAEAIKSVPRGVVCLLSALRLHELTTQSPFEVWLALDRKAHRPAGDGVPLHVVRFSGRALTAGVEEHLIDGVKVPIYSAAKTVADCFKYRNKIGLDIALEALRDYWKGRHWDADQLWKCAKICRVSNVMRPYMEALA
jgi:predicted transcriptional regulator of viral defense system